MRKSKYRRPYCRDDKSAGALWVEVPLVLLGSLGLTFLVLRHWAGDNCLERVADHEVAVIGRAFGADAKTVTTPGYVGFLPWLEEVVRLDRSPLEYVMGDEAAANAESMPRLIVRGSDGASFWFNTVRVQFAIDPTRAAFVLADSGAGNAERRSIVDAYARAVLRAEFGRFTSEEIVEPDNRHLASQRARASLAQELERHGLLVLDLAVSKPSFAAQYEATIERRKVAEQDLERVQRKLADAAALRERRLLVARREAEREATRKKGELERKVEDARGNAQQIRREAERYREDRLAEAARELAKLNLEASLVHDRTEKEAQALVERAKAYAGRGELAVREALVERLAEMTFTLAPPVGRAETATNSTPSQARKP